MSAFCKRPHQTLKQNTWGLWGVGGSPVYRGLLSNPSRLYGQDMVYVCTCVLMYMYTVYIYKHICVCATPPPTKNYLASLTFYPSSSAPGRSYTRRKGFRKKHGLENHLIPIWHIVFCSVVYRVYGICYSVPGPERYVKSWPFWLLLVALGHCFAYFWEPGTENEHPW